MKIPTTAELEQRLEELNREEAIIRRILSMLENPEYAEALSYLAAMGRSGEASASPAPLLTLRKRPFYPRPDKVGTKTKLVIAAMEIGKDYRCRDLVEPTGGLNTSDISSTLRGAAKAHRHGIEQVQAGLYRRVA